MKHRKLLLTTLPLFLVCSTGFKANSTSLFDYDEILYPFWEGNISYNETILVVEEQDGTIAPVPLLYYADEIIEVKSASLTTTFIEGDDYDIENGKLIVKADGDIPRLTWRQMHPQTIEELEYQTPVDVFESDEGGYINLHEGTYYHDRQIVVTYKHSDDYEGYIPENKSNLLPKLTQKLNNHENLDMLIYGDSISTGANSSGRYWVDPNLPIYPELFRIGLERKYDIEINSVNESLGGKNSVWAVENLDNVIARSKGIYDYDLIVIAFGMNDPFSAKQTAANEYRVVQLLQAEFPNAEFILVGTMLPNPHCPRAITYQGEQAEKLLDYEEKGIAVANVTEVHRSVLEKKRFADMTGNEINHANDYTARLYAQTLLQTVGATPESDPALKDSSDLNSYWVNELYGFKGNGFYTDSTGKITALNGIGRYFYDYDYSNIEIKGTYTFTNIGEGGSPSFTINARSKCSDPDLMTWDSRGYEVEFYSNGMYALYKNSTALISPSWGAQEIVLNTPTEYVFKVTDCKNGSVHLSASINGTQVFSYFDSQDQLLEGGIGGFTNAIIYSVEGLNQITPIINLVDTGTLATASRFSSTITNNIVTTEALPFSGYSGVIVKNSLNSQGFGFKTTGKIVEDGINTGFVFQIGGKMGIFNNYCEPSLIDPWAWEDPGYLLHIFKNGHTFLSRGSWETTTINETWLTFQPVTGTSYEFEYAMSSYEYGNLITLSVNGATIYRYFDIPSAENTPLVLPTGKYASQRDMVRFCGVYSYLSKIEFKFDDKIETTKQTALDISAGRATSKSGSYFLEDGEIEECVPYDTVRYNPTEENYEFSFNANFYSEDDWNTSITVSLGSKYNKDGYSFTLYRNSMFAYSKNNEQMILDWGFIPFGFNYNETYLITTTKKTLGSGAVFVSIKANDAVILELVDTVDPSEDSGYFAITSNGMYGKIYENGYERPVINSSAETILTKETVSFSYINPQPDDVVNYYINKSVTTAKGTLSDNIFTPTTVGNVGVYVVVNGVASFTKEVAITTDAKCNITPSAEKIVIDEEFSIQASMSDESEIMWVTYYLENLSGYATIDEKTGEITGISAGMVKVWAVANGVTSEKLNLIITAGIEEEYDYEQAKAWSIYFVTETRTDDVCLAATDILKLAGLQGLWETFAETYRALPEESKTAFCYSGDATITIARNHYEFIVNKFGAENLGESGNFVVDGENIPYVVSLMTPATIEQPSGDTTPIVICVCVITIVVLSTILIIKKRKHI